MCFGILIILTSIISGQIFTTVPKNVFRFSYARNQSESNWDLKDQSFNLRGVGRHYFDQLTHNDSVRFSSDYDLYHNGSFRLNSAKSVEEWLIRFNNTYGTNLPIFEAIGLDTSTGISVTGEFLESLARKTQGKSFKIEYGMSNQITLSVSIPFFDSYTIDRSVAATGNVVGGVDDLLNYHSDARSNLEDFIGSSSFSGYSQGIRDTIRAIYNIYYSSSSEYNVLWAFHSQNDPLNNGFTDPRFYLNKIKGDTITLDSLVAFYYPVQRSNSGFDDIAIGVTFLLRGKPGWAHGGKSKALYGRFSVGIPYGKTISSYQKKGMNQFKEIKIGAGVTRWSFGLFGNYNFTSSMKGRTYFQTSFKMSTSELLNTPAQLFSGGHSHPDSIISQIGSTYRYNEGNWFNNKIGLEFEPGPNRIRMRVEFNFISKTQDKFDSKNSDWDKWMQSHSGYDSAFKRTDLKIEFWILNSISTNRIGPFPFDLFGGYQNSIFSENTYGGWTAFGGITTYFQGW